VDTPASMRRMEDCGDSSQDDGISIQLSLSAVKCCSRNRRARGERRARDRRMQRMRLPSAPDGPDLRKGEDTLPEGFRVLTTQPRRTSRTWRPVAAVGRPGGKDVARRERARRRDRGGPGANRLPAAASRGSPARTWLRHARSSRRAGTRPCSPRRRTSRLSSGEFIRSGSDSAAQAHVPYPEGTPLRSTNDSPPSGGWCRAYHIGKNSGSHAETRGTRRTALRILRVCA
jgi:hypothetical protein